ncbi:MAG TPA: FAD-dependent oxidoreductase [Candidatus Dormibacteraeota bacterium]|nr:FAD-dependent oxidoreductase [Candidatus Dormibacteraeota bacterium]
MGSAMGYRISCDTGNCINCGICMDVCPVQALDMTRPTSGGVESAGYGWPLRWMMEYPTQVGECIGCTVCVRECPVHVLSIDSVEGATPLAPRQGPIERPFESPGWVPLSKATREALKPDHPSPFDPFFAWSTREPASPRPTWGAAGAAEPLRAPCQVACPAGTDAGRYVGLIAEGRYDDAYAVAAEVNPFPSVCGWICTAPCEAACRRGTLDEPVSIRTLKRFAVEHGRLPKVDAPATRRSKKVAIVGGGPAGMSAAYYLVRLGYSVTVFEAMPVPGGMMAIGIPSYRLPRETLQAEIQRILDLGVELRLDTAMGRDFSLSDLEREGFEAIFLSTGAPKSRRLGVEGDQLRGVVPATVFLKQVNLGTPPRYGGPVVVVGGGSTAMDAARSALRCGAPSVTVLYRRGRTEMPAQHEEVEEAEREGILVRTGAVITEVLGREGSVTGIRVERQEPTGRVEGGRAVWAPVDGSEETLPVSVVLVAIGEEPDPSILPEGAGIEVSSWAGIVADPQTLATGHAGVFAGGDVVSGPKTIIDAVASGRRAAGSIHEYLARVADGEAEIMAAVRYRTPPEPTLRLDLAARARARAPLPVYQPGSFEAAQQGFDAPTALAEAARCFRCDAVAACPSVDVIAGRGPERAQRSPFERPTAPLAAADAAAVAGSGPTQAPSTGGLA